MENSDIDYFSMQALQRKNDVQQAVNQSRETQGYEGMSNQASEKLFEQYLGLDSEATENTVPK